MSANHRKSITVTERPRASSANSLSSLKTPRIARFAEATTIHSPIDAVRSPFTSHPPTNHYTPQPQPADFGLEYYNEKHMSVEMEEVDSHQQYAAPLVSPPLKSAMKTPGAPPKSSKSAFFGPDENFREEEENLEKEEALTEREQARDLVSRAVPQIRLVNRQY